MRVIIQEVALRRATAPDNRRFVHTLPTINAVEVVRCKECKRRRNAYECPFRQLMHTEGKGYHYVDMTTDDDYCSFGERKGAEA